MNRALLAGSVTLGAALLPVCLIASGVPLFPASVAPAPQIVVDAGRAVAAPAPAGTDTIIVRLAAKAADPVAAATLAVREAALGVSTAAVVGGRLIGPGTVAVTLDARLSDSLAQKLAKATAKRAGVGSADRSLTVVPAASGVQDYQWNLAPVSSGVYGVDAAHAWGTTTGKGVVVGVVDTGIASNPSLPAAASTKVTHVNGSIVVGSTGPNITVTATRTGDTSPLCTTTSDGTGAFTCRFTSRPADSDILAVNATDALGRTSGVTVEVGDASTQKPTMEPSRGTEIEGTAEARASVTLTYTRDGTTIGTDTTTADDHGAWSVEPSTPLENADTVTAIATDAAGNVSEPSDVLTIDAYTAKPTLKPSRGTEIDGTAEAGASVTLTYTRDGDTLGTDTTTATDEGTWAVTPDPPLKDADTVTAVATDTLGNVSERSDVLTIDAFTAKPTMEPSTGSRIDGTAEAGASVTLTYTRNGTTIGTDTTTADEHGAWSVAPSTPLENADTVTAIATDTLDNVSEPSDVLTIDAYTRPPRIRPTNGRTVTGTAEGRASVTLTYTRNGDILGTDTATATSDGGWSVTPSLELRNGDVITAIATDPLGNVSNRSWPRTVDAFTPAPTIDPSNGRTITGTAEARASVALTYTRDGEVIGTDTTTAGRGGTWSISPSIALVTGDVVTAVATDALGNVSATSGSVTVDSSTSLPTLEPSNGKTITGTAEAGASLALTYARAGDTIGTGAAVADADGNWSATPSVDLKNGDTVTVIATDSVGNVSEPASLIVDAFTPDPTMAPSNGKSIAGTAEAGARLSVTYTRDGDVVGADTTTTGTGGEWTLTPSTELKDGDVVTATATDVLGNTSAASSLTIDAFSPAPTVEPSDGTTIAGTAEPGARLALTYTRNGDPVGTDAALADGDGTWSLTPSTTLQDGDVVTVVATDALGNTSEASSSTVTVAASPTPEPSGSPSPTATDSPMATASESADPGATESGSPAASDSPSPTTPDPTDTSQPASPTTDGGQGVAPAASGSGTTIPAASGGFVAQSTSPSAAASSGTNLVGTVLPGRNFYDGGASAWTDSDPGSHGTHVAGILAGTGLGNAPAGVAPAVQIEPLRAMNAAGGTMDAVIEAIYWGIGITPDGTRNDNPYPVDVLNLSIQTQNAASCPTALQAAIDAAAARNVVVVAAAGNYNTSIVTSAPANCNNVIVVTASTASGARAGYSSWGTSGTTSAWLVAAPGGSGDSAANCTAASCPSWILSQIGDKLVAKAGTSMAAPHVAAVAGLLKAANRALTPAQIARIIRGTAIPMSDGCPTAVCGSGIVNAAAAVAKAGDATSVTSADGVSATVSVAVTGSRQVGAVLTAGPLPGATSYTTPSSYQWLRGDGNTDVPIPGETSSSYRITGADYGKYVSVRVSTALGGVTTTVGKASVWTRGYLSPLQRPTATGKSYKVKKTLKASIGGWSPVTPTSVKYQWYRSGKKIKKATKATYKLTKSDRGKSVKVKVTVSAVGYYTTYAYSTSHKIKR